MPCKSLRVGIYKCKDCGACIEIFSDEKKAKCTKCGSIIIKSKLKACVEWCSGAKECVGKLPKDAKNTKKVKKAL